MSEINLIHLLWLEVVEVSSSEDAVLTLYLKHRLMFLKRLILVASQPLISLGGCWPKQNDSASNHDLHIGLPCASATIILIIPFAFRDFTLIRNPDRLQPPLFLFSFAFFSTPISGSLQASRHSLASL